LIKNRFFALVLILLLSAGFMGCERSALTPALPSASAPAPRVSTQELPGPSAQPIPSETPPVLLTPTASPPAGDAADLAEIQHFDPSPAVLVDSGNFLQVYRARAMLRRYQTARWTYILDPASHQILQIQPVEETAVQVGSPLGSAQLEQAARAWIAKAAPGVRLEGLTPAHTSADGNFIFHWEDRTRPLLEDGFSYPFIQAALTASGDLLNFYNTLPLE
jgi:hypothetical protein